MKIHGLFKKSMFAIVSGFVIAIPAAVYATGYKMEFQSASVFAGNGEAAALEDAGTNWYNSAGNVYIPQQSAISVIDVYAPTVFTGNSSAPSSVSPLFNYNASGSASSHPNSVIPAIHYNHPIQDRFAFGISIVPAWGFKEDYGFDSILRYDLTSVYTKTIDVAPSLSMKLNEHWSFGLGPDFNYFSVQSESNVRTEPLTTGDSIQRFTAQQWKTGWHAGVLYRLNDQTRIGLNYRSKIIMDLEGYSDFALRNIQGFESDQFALRIPLPANTTLSAYHEVTKRLAILATVAYDEWGVLKAYHAKNIIQPPPLPGLPPVLLDVSIPQNMTNAWNYSLGSHYKLNDQWMLRGSIKYEETPTNDQDRDINFPDGPKWGFHIGSRYQMTKKIAIDLIYGHAFVAQVPIDAVNPVSLSHVNGHQRTHIDLFGGQIVVTI